jgi:GT2 family glycosyltransferase
MTDLSIIIVCYKGWERLKKCLDALKAFRGENFKFEIIVVDNNSGEDTIDRTEKMFPKFRFIHNTINGGFGNGCNLGSKVASGEFVLFLNPDTIASETEVEKLLNRAKQNPGWTIISCRQVNEKGKESAVCGQFPSIFNLTGFQRAILRNLIPHPDNPSDCRASTSPFAPDISFPDWISGSVVLIRRESFLKLSGFDEDFWMYFEDVDLCRRVRNNDGEIAFCPDITVEHNHGGSSRINLKTTSLTKTEVYISRHVYISKHKTGAEKHLIQTFLVLNALISGAILASIGLILFFIPKMFSRAKIFCGLIRYYTGSVFRSSWVSPRSVNFRNRIK